MSCDVSQVTAEPFKLPPGEEGDRMRERERESERPEVSRIEAWSFFITFSWLKEPLAAYYANVGQQDLPSERVMRTDRRTDGKVKGFLFDIPHLFIYHKSNFP